MSHSPYRRNDSASGALRGWPIPDDGIFGNDAGRKHALRAAIFSGVPGERFLLAIDPANQCCQGAPSISALFAEMGGKRCHSFLAESLEQIQRGFFIKKKPPCTTSKTPH
jgi:hypothetical protein